MYLFTRASVINYHKLEARTTEFSCFGSQKSEIKVLARLVPSGDSHKTVTCLSHLLVAADSPWHSLACSCITLCPHHHTVFFPVCLCLPLSVFLLKTSITGFGTPLIQYDLILTNYICKDTISKRSHILRFHVDINLE